MTMIADMPSSALPAKPTPRLGLQIGLILLSAYLFVSALPEVGFIFIDHSLTDPFRIFAQYLSNLKTGLAPIISGAALFYAVRRKPNHAIVAIATLLLVTWFSEMPSLVIEGMWPKVDFVGVAGVVLYPLFAIAAMSLALRNERLVTAAFMAAIPAVGKYVGFILYVIGDAIYRSYF